MDYLITSIAVLAVLCVVFPAEGVKAAGVDLSFPSLSEALGAENSAEEAMPQETPEELLAKQLQILQKKSETNSVFRLLKNLKFPFRAFSMKLGIVLMMADLNESTPL